jgi:SWIM zinc finger
MSDGHEVREAHIEQGVHEVQIDFERAAGIDLDRLERSLGLRGERVAPGRYRVTGGSHEHWVDLYTGAHPRCDCGDHLWRDRICKHMLAALLREGNERVLTALPRLIARAHTTV